MSRIRVTGGAWRSRLLQVTAAPGLRPTPDRVRETLFNWLGQDLTGLSCLDLFAGSGILGIEAASRGAAPVVFVERERQPFLMLVKQLAAFDGDSLQPLCCDALKFAPSAGFDLVFLDPPYRQGWLERLVPRLPLLARPDARLYVESEAPLDQLGGWQVTRRGQAGQVHFHLLEQA